MFLRDEEHDQIFHIFIIPFSFFETYECVALIHRNFGDFRRFGKLAHSCDLIRIELHVDLKIVVKNITSTRGGTSAGWTFDSKY
jgi:hypothetical protein